MWIGIHFYVVEYFHDPFLLRYNFFHSRHPLRSPSSLIVVRLLDLFNNFILVTSVHFLASSGVEDGVEDLTTAVLPSQIGFAIL